MLDQLLISALNPPRLNVLAPTELATRPQGLFRHMPEDFIVDEVPAYVPEGQGDHVFVKIEKRDLNTQDAISLMARELGIDAKEAGYAGLKDKRAVCTQWVSVLCASDEPFDRYTLDNPRILEFKRHPHKLRMGHLRGNQFTIRLRDVKNVDLDGVRARLDALTVNGLPNFYGVQRFGVDARNLRRAWAWQIEDQRMSMARHEAKFLVSALQSAIFNHLLAERMRQGYFQRLIPGDLMQKEDTGGLFTTSDVQVDQARMDDWQISPTGPILGKKMRSPEGEGLAFETAIVSQLPKTELWTRRLGPGSRRALRVRVKQASLEAEKSDVVLRFELPKGSYATSVLIELFGELFKDT